jgi:hypothetical protein
MSRRSQTHRITSMFTIGLKGHREERPDGHEERSRDGMFGSNGWLGPGLLQTRCCPYFGTEQRYAARCRGPRPVARDAWYVVEFLTATDRRRQRRMADRAEAPAR